jgi:putative ABC transport system permease protein
VGRRAPEESACTAELCEQDLTFAPLSCASTPIGRSGLAKVPVIDSTKTTGLVFVPGAMTGMILAGAGPLQAVRLQVTVVFMLRVAVSPTATLVSRPPPGACSRCSSNCDGWRAARSG